jgi:alkylhydroperoxidase family enzyme
VYLEAVRRVERAIWTQDVLDVFTLELCRLRIAQLLRCDVALHDRTPAQTAAGYDPDRVAALPRWDSSDLFDDRLRVCLGYAEQVVIDTQGVDDEMAASVVDAIGEGGFLVLTYACAFFETTQRARIVLGERKTDE